MDFSVIELDAETKDFWREARQYITDHISPEMREPEDRHAHDMALTKALGERGWWNLLGWQTRSGSGGLEPLRQRIIDLELLRSDAALIARGPTALALEGIEAYGTEDLKADIVPKVLRGEVCICLGYTEPDAGSDLAGVKTRASRDQDGWVINGSKMFTTVAQYCAYTFLLARSDPSATKHKGLTMFLVPLSAPGVEIKPISTLGDERTNLVFFTDVRISDYYRLGSEGEGWRVLSGPLNAEHGILPDDEYHLAEINGAGIRSTANIRDLVDEAIHWARQEGHSNDPIIRRRIAQVALDAEACRNTPGAMGRVVASESLIRDAADLIDMVGPAALLSREVEGHVGTGLIEWTHRHAQGTATYGGTTDVFRNIIAERILGLPRSTR